MYNVEEFAVKIKEKYPAYKDMDNLELTNKIIEKYPAYKEQVNFEEEPSALKAALPFSPQVQEAGADIGDRLSGAFKGIKEAGAGIQERTRALKEADKTIGEGRLIEQGAIAIGGAGSLISGAIGGFFSPEFEKLATTIVENTPETVKVKVAEGLKKVDDELNKLEPEARAAVENSLFGIGGIFELVGGSLTTKLGTGVVKGIKKAGDIVKEGVDIASDISIKAKAIADDFVKARQVKQDVKLVNNVSEGIDDILGERALVRAEKSNQFKNSDIRSQLKDPEVFAGLKVEDTKVNPDDAIALLHDRVDSAMNTKRAAIEVADQRLPKVKKEEVRVKALESLDEMNLSDKGVLDITKQIDAELDAMPDEFLISQLDNARAKFRNAAVDAKGVQKQGSHYTALENGTRDLVFDKMDNIPGADGGFPNLNKYIKDTINTMTFLDKNLRGKTVKGGRLTKLFAQNLGAIAGSGGGALGSITGGLAAGAIQDILSNKALGNTIKKKMLLNFTDNTPEAIKQVDDMLKDLGDIKELPAPTTEFRSQIRDPRVIPLAKEAPSTIEAREMQRLSKQVPKFGKGSKSAAGQTTGAIGDVKPKNTKLIEEAKKFDTAEEFIKKEAVRKQLIQDGTKINADDTVTLYHATTKEIVDKINNEGLIKGGATATGCMTGLDLKPSAFFGTEKQWVHDTWGGKLGNIVEVKVPLQHIRKPSQNKLEVYFEGGLKRKGDKWEPVEKVRDTFYNKVAEELLIDKQQLTDIFNKAKSSN